MIKNFTILFLLALCIRVTAQPPQGYYNSAEGLTGTALQQALHDIIDNHTSISYDALWTAFESTDKKDNGKVWDMYSDKPGGTPSYEFTFGTKKCGNYSKEGDCYNREHSWPKSWFSEKTPMYSDLFHLCPTDGYVNNRRSNYPYGEVSNYTWKSTNGSKVGNCSFPGYSGVVFEPIDEYKGDFARNYFYMTTRYYHEDNGWAGSPMTTGSQLKPWAVNLLLKWHAQDPVSQKEIDRNNAVFGIQHNRNPYIDRPEWAQAIWGPLAVREQQVTVLMTYPSPATDYCIVVFPETTSLSKVTSTVYTITGTSVNAPVWTESNTLKVNVGNLKAGVYFLNLKVDNQTYRAKIVKN